MKRSHDLATEHNLYLDYQKERAARKGKGNNRAGKEPLKKVTWEDKYGNVHDLDYVLESGGTEEVIGSPRAFIEAAWRRSTRHLCEACMTGEPA